MPFDHWDPLLLRTISLSSNIIQYSRRRTGIADGKSMHRTQQLPSSPSPTGLMDSFPTSRSTPRTVPTSTTAMAMTHVPRARRRLPFPLHRRRHRPHLWPRLPVLEQTAPRPLPRALLMHHRVPWPQVLWQARAPSRKVRAHLVPRRR